MKFTKLKNSRVWNVTYDGYTYYIGGLSSRSQIRKALMNKINDRKKLLRKNNKTLSA